MNQGQEFGVIPVHVIAESANEAELLNGLLHAQGLAVKSAWTNDLDDWQGPSAELVFYFADTAGPALEDAVAHAGRQDAALIVVARDRDPAAAARALVVGAADRVCIEDGELIAAVARRERRKRRIAGSGPNGELVRRLKALEAENERLRREADAPRRSEADGGWLRPQRFARIVAEQLGLPKPGLARAVIIIHPADPETTLATFGPLGMAEVGTAVSAILSPLLEAGDYATLTGDLNALAFVVRPDEAGVKDWIETALRQLAKQVFEDGGHSARLDFVAGYAPVDRIRRLDALMRRAEEAALNAMPGTISRGADDDAAADVDDESWVALIREALEAHRYTLTLSPIEDLTTGIRSWAALPRLLDRDNREIGIESFQPPAERLGLLQALEHRFVGHALRALLQMSRSGRTPHMLVPLRFATVADSRFSGFLGDLIAHAHRPLPAGRLVLELDIGEVAGRIRDTERFAARAHSFGFALGLRNYRPGTAADKLVGLLPVASLRMSADVMSRLAVEDNGGLSAIVETAAERLKNRGILLIATGICDPAAMATLYNLGIGTVEGPLIGEPRPFPPARSES